MASTTTTTRTEPVKGTLKNPSIGSAMPAATSKSNAADADGLPDIQQLIRTAGSAEAVIQYLLKEKQSQAQQNAKLWSLVDKQRGIILELDRDLRRALKEKEKYKKKLKELLEASRSGSSSQVPNGQQAGTNGVNSDPSATREQVIEIPASPVPTADSPRPSPIDVALAPYPITPPGDHGLSNSPRTGVEDLLNPVESMPKPSDHALDHFDHEREELEAEAAAKKAEEENGLHIHVNIPPSRLEPREPPRIPPPQLPVGLPDRSPKLDDSKFPPPTAPPPRKPPPAPLHLKNPKPRPDVSQEEELDTDTDYDKILEVDDADEEERRGRRRTREEDDRERAIQAKKEAELRSLSKKSKKSSSQKGMPKEEALEDQAPPTPRAMFPPRGPASLAGVLSGALGATAPPPLMSPGLPVSPRPVTTLSSPNSPPLSPRGAGAYAGMPLSPRPPRQPIPLPPNTPLSTPSPAAGDAAPALKSHQPPSAANKEHGSTPSPTKSNNEERPPERKKIYKGFVTEEYPDLLLPPNALPHIDIKVASSRMKPSRASLISLTQLEEDPVFTLAVYSRADGGELWRIEKDSASLAKLDHRLKQCPNFTAKTPDRSLFSGHSPAKLDARRDALNQYLDELLNTPLDHDTALELCKYLSTNTLPPNADETGSSDSGHERVGPGGRPYRSGYLTKRGKNFGGWKARYFVLDGPQLKYYETPGGAHLGTIKLRGAQIGKQTNHSNDGSQGSNEDGDNQYRHAFLILEPKKKDPNSMTKHVLCAESDKERDQWVDALIRWVDYKDPEEEESQQPSKESKKDHHGHDRNGSERNHGKKKSSGQAKQQQNGDEELVGVSYEATKPGEAPSGHPGKKHGAPDQDSVHSHSTVASYNISAPRDGHVITNSESWGNKQPLGLGLPSQEEKKARKRSFFGFGPKTRTSSDGQDSLFGSEGGNSPAAQTKNPFNGPVREVFGASLAEAVKYCSPVDVRVPLPAVVYRCIQYLEAKNAVSEEGIFRLSGSSVVIKQLRERFNQEGDVNLLNDSQYHDIHAVASLLKLYLRELPATILTNELRPQFQAVTEMQDQSQKLAALSELVARLPQPNATLLKYLISFLIKIIDNSDVNKMNVRNVGIVFSPTLNIPAPVFAMFLQNFEAIFGINPADYELPVPEPEFTQERRPSLPTSFQERRPSDAARPSTSHSDSPHRHRLLDSLDSQGNRSTPTPPPMTMQQMAQLNAANMAARNTPTPPGQRIMHESASMSSLRPAYETGFSTPPQYASSLPAGYDRPHYENGLTPGYEQTYRSRRESAMFMGQLTQQPSKSRLREETQF